jgi:uncharacterized delta-60 repeat protein
MLVAVLCVLCALPGGAAGDALPLQDPSDLDPSFGAGGIWLGPGDGQLRDLREDAHGRFVAAGYLREPGRVVVGRHLPNGLPDPSFGTDGRVEHQLGLGAAPGSGASALELDTAGRFVLGGSASTVGGRSNALVARLAPDGRLDDSFGSAGRVAIAPPDATISTVADVVEDAEGRLLVTIEAWRDGGEGRRAIVRRLTPAGQPDQSFGAAGAVELGAGSAGPVALAPDGDVLVAHDTPSFAALEVVRLDPDGQPDEAFGDGGRAVVPVRPPESLEVYDPGTDGLWVRADGSVLLGGTGADPTAPMDWNTGLVLAVARVTPAGEPDPAFGTNGLATLRPDPEHRTWNGPVSVAEDPHGKIVVVGTVSGHVLAGRMLADGRPDHGFGDQGVRRRQFVPGDSNNILGDVLVRDGGQILVAGLGGTPEACCAPALMQLRGADVPDTLLEAVPGLEVVTSTVRFVLGALPATGLFECRLDEGPWEPCGPVVELTGLENAVHVFEARAVTAGGLLDADGVRYEFTVAVPPAPEPELPPDGAGPPPVDVELPPVDVELPPVDGIKLPPVTGGLVGPPASSRRPGTDTIAPAVDLRVAAVQALAAALRSGVAVRARCSEDCALRAELHAGPSAARRLRLGRRRGTVVLGRAARRLPAGRAAGLRVRVRSRYARRLTGTVRATLVTVARDRARNEVATRRTLTLR